MTATLQFINAELIASVVEQARKSPRRRMNYNFHAGPSDNPHRFLNVMLEGTYVTPHRHLAPPKAEAFIVLEGWIAAFVFDESGAVTSAHAIGVGPPPAGLALAPAGCGVDFAAGVWHSTAALTPYVVIYEVKPGPWDPATDKEFATWAPREGDPAAAEYLSRLVGPLTSDSSRTA